MFGSSSQDDDQLRKAQEALLNEMTTYGPDSAEYPQMLGYLERINLLRKDQRPERVSPNTLAVVAGNLLGIFVIVAYEQRHVLTSKGLNFILKPS